MEDRFKFRVFNKNSSEMVYIYGWGTSYSLEEKLRYRNTAGEVFNYNYNDIAIMQCAGHRDCNDKLIYECDMLKLAEDEPLIRVEFCEKCSALTTFYPYSTTFVSTPNGEDEVLCNIEWDCQICDSNFSMNDQFHDVEIIGNIHEHPELLGEQK